MLMTMLILLNEVSDYTMYYSIHLGRLLAIIIYIYKTWSIFYVLSK